MTAICERCQHKSISHAYAFEFVSEEYDTATGAPSDYEPRTTVDGVPVTTLWHCTHALCRCDRLVWKVEDAVFEELVS